MKPSINYNSEKNGVEISFATKPDASMRAKLQSLGFKYHGRKKFWYAIVNDQVKAFVNNELRQYAIEFTTDEVIDGDQQSETTYEATLENIDKANFTYVTIAFFNVEDKLDYQDYLVFVPSRAKADEIATAFAKGHYGDQLKEVVVFPRNYKRKARRLFQHGYVINADGALSGRPAVETIESKETGKDVEGLGNINAAHSDAADQNINSQAFIPTYNSEESTSESRNGKPQEESNLPEVTVPNEDYLDRVVAMMHQHYANGHRSTKKQIENMAIQVGVTTGRMWEAAELSWLLWYKNLYNERTSFEIRLSRMIQFWNNLQPTYAYSDSSKEIFKQYSTPCPISAIIAQYTLMDKAQSIFEPSAGNGLLLVGADPLKTHVNEIDGTRLQSLQFQGFKKISSYNAAQPFPSVMARAYDVVVTNPPFTRWEDEKFDRQNIIEKYFHNHVGLSQHLRLEQVMAGLALHCLKDTGKAAIIIMGHVYFEDGYIAKYRPFFNWLYRHYWIDDVINLNSFKLYNKQGAVERVMLILVAGRKDKASGIAPTKIQVPQLGEVINSFEDLWHRVRPHIYSPLANIIYQLKTALEP